MTNPREKTEICNVRKEKRVVGLDSNSQTQAYFPWLDFASSDPFYGVAETMLGIQELSPFSSIGTHFSQGQRVYHMWYHDWRVEERLLSFSLGYYTYLPSSAQKPVCIQFLDVSLGHCWVYPRYRPQGFFMSLSLFHLTAMPASYKC